jgi:cell division protein FtsN
MAALRRPPRRRVGTFLVLVGITGILTTTFVAGVWTGRHWAVLTGASRPGQVAEAAGRGRASGERPRPAETLPPLTFYQELTAPLTAPPPPVKAPRPRPPDLIKRDESPPHAEAPRSEPPGPPDMPGREALPGRSDAPAAATPFTIQVGAYNARPPADALRATLAAAGHDARVVEATTASGVRYRVQVGAFPTREAAQDIAARLSAERSLSTFVTTR